MKTPSLRREAMAQAGSLSLLDSRSLEKALEAADVKDLHHRTVWHHVIYQRQEDSSKYPNLPLRARAALSRFKITSTVALREESKDRTTTKLVVRLFDGLDVETVIMRYSGWSTACVSSQVGCRMGCSFCATGTLGLKSSLTEGEILEQLWHANGVSPIRNVVFMGMGEPLDNYDEVVRAVNSMVAKFGLSYGRITVSTVGVVPKMLQLVKDAPGVSLALSLHAPTQELRREIVPSAAAYPVSTLLDTAEKFIRQQQSLSRRNEKYQRVQIEYCLIAGVNDQPETAMQLANLLEGRDWVILNVIPYNPTLTPVASQRGYSTPSQEAIEGFTGVLKASNVRVFVRQEMGQDISGACGQLVLKQARSSVWMYGLTAVGAFAIYALWRTRRRKIV
ncbi:MAG: hypothetical protein KVP17_003704 [Porospora cf. gigantea B]|uniref:uncharacterized protein n=1 Tax=Porospora cf. gigantea B TaxID=2853592 RepID=UPI00357188CD|nr:MAG: hypothetical protein KVP17_003704 [Porospora cf. gigantea B]